MCVLFNNSISSQIYAKCFVLNVSFLEENPGLRSPNQGRRSKMKVICLYLSSARLSHRVCLLGCPLTTDPVEGQRRLSSNLHQSPCSGRKKIPRSNTCEMFIIVITLIIHEIIGIRCCLLPSPPLLSEEHLAKKIAASTGPVIGFGARRLVVRIQRPRALHYYLLGTNIP